MKPELLVPDERCLSLEEAYRYSHGQSTETERARVEVHITTCDLCFDALAGARKMGSLEEARARTQALHESNLRTVRGEKKIPRTLHWPAFTLAAAAAVLIVFGGIWMVNRHPHQNLAYEQFKPFPNTIPITRGNLSDLEDAMAYYELGQYETAAHQLESHLAKQPGDMKAALYTGVSWLACKQPGKSISWLTSIKHDAAEYTDAQWYLMLAYVANEELAKAVALIEAGAFNNTEYSEVAGKILQSLR